MSDTRHTPGPWHKEDRRPSGWLIVPSDPTIAGYIAWTGATISKDDGHEWLGDPDLLVASPDLLEATEQAMMAGNSIANVCIELIGHDFAQRFPPNMDTWAVADTIGTGARFEAWCAWKTIMNIRDVHAKATGKGDQHD